MRERSIHEQFEWRVCNFYEGNSYEGSKKKYYDTNEGTFEGTRYEGTKLLRVKKITTKVQQIYYEGTKVQRYKITTKVLNLTFVYYLRSKKNYYLRTKLHVQNC